MRMRPLAVESLPEGYTKCEYLEGSGAQRIVLPFNFDCATDEGIIETDLSIEGNNASSIAEVGEGVLYYTNSCTIFWGARPYKSYIGVGFGTSHYDISWGYVPLDSVRHSFKLQFNNNAQKAWIDNELKVSAAKNYGTTKLADIGLFGVVWDTSGSSAKKIIGKKSYFKLQLNGKTVYDMVPALSPTGAPCMFDLVTQTPFYNENTSGSDFLYKAYSYPFNPGNNWHTFRRKLTDIIGDTKYVAESVTENGVDKFVLHTDRLTDDKLQSANELLDKVIPQNIEVEQYNHNMEISWRDINKYAECVTVADMKAVNADYLNDVTSDGEWVYPLPNAENLNFAFQKSTNLRVIKAAWPKAYAVDNAISAKSVLEADLELPGCYAGQKQGHTVSGLLAGEKLKKARLIIPNVTSIMHMCFYSYALTDIELYCPKLSAAGYAFYQTKLNKPSAINILRNLPPYTAGSHLLTIGIHVNHKTDEEVLEAIANAEAKGWTLTVQWNPGGPTYTTPEVSTFGLRKPPIYARVSELELPDGTTERVLDWGHYVTDPSGYEEFSSVEEAREYFGLSEEVAENE